MTKYAYPGKDLLKGVKLAVLDNQDNQIVDRVPNSIKGEPTQNGVKIGEVCHSVPNGG